MRSRRTGWLFRGCTRDSPHDGDHRDGLGQNASTCSSDRLTYNAVALRVEHDGSKVLWSSRSSKPDCHCRTLWTGYATGYTALLLPRIFIVFFASQTYGCPLDISLKNVSKGIGIFLCQKLLKFRVALFLVLWPWFLGDPDFCTENSARALYVYSDNTCYMQY